MVSILSIFGRVGLLANNRRAYVGGVHSGSAELVRASRYAKA